MHVPYITMRAMHARSACKVTCFILIIVKNILFIEKKHDFFTCFHTMTISNSL